jgi:sugar-specific transcriptional regulator TrmB
MLMDLEQTLRKVGLSSNEAKVYLALLRTGSSKAGGISKEAGINRTSTYDSFRSLLEKGLISYVIIGKVKWFQASDPRNLRVFLKNKIEVLDEAMPQLSRIHSSEKLKESVSLFKGKKGVKTVLKDIIATGEDNCVFGSEGQLEERMPEYAEKFVRQLSGKDIRVRSLVRSGRKGKVGSNSAVRFVPKNVESPVVTNVYGNKIAMIIWSEPPEAILIENRMAAKAYRSYFEFMWANAGRKSGG